MTTHHDPRPRLDSAQLLCTRLSLGLRGDELAGLLGVEERSVAAWEAGREVPAFVFDALSVLARRAAGVVVDLTEQAHATGLITTFDTNDAAAGASGLTVPFASVHRVCAGRASIDVPAAAVVRVTADGDNDARLMCRAAACGLGLKQLNKFLGASQRTVQRWLVDDDRPAPHWATAMVDELVERARAHTDDLAERIVGGALEVCADPVELTRQWPTAQVPLPTHQVCAARAAFAADGDVALRFIS